MVYNLRPKIKVKHDSRTWKNYTQIADEISQQFVNGKRTLAFGVLSRSKFT